MSRIQDKYISPFTDFGFKKLFGTEPNKDLLIDFLNELLKQDEGKIIDLSFLPKEQLGRIDEDRRAIFDIYCENEQGEKFIVELQKAKQNYFKDRSIYYSTFPIRSQAKKENGTFNSNQSIPSVFWILYSMKIRMTRMSITMKFNYLIKQPIKYFITSSTISIWKCLNSIKQKHSSLIIMTNGFMY